MSLAQKQKIVSCLSEAKNGTHYGNVFMRSKKTFSYKLGLIYPEILIYTDILVHCLLAFHS